MYVMLCYVMYVCMYVCICLCIYLCMYVCIYVSMYLCIYVSMYLCIYVSMYLCIYVCKLHYVCRYIYIYRVFSAQLAICTPIRCIHSRLFKIPLLLSQVHEEWSKCMLKASLEAGSKWFHVCIKTWHPPKTDGSSSFHVSTIKHC